MGRSAHELSNHWGRLPKTVRGRTRGQSQRVAGDLAAERGFAQIPEVEEALLTSACYERGVAWRHSDNPRRAYLAVGDAATNMAPEPIEHDAGKKRLHAVWIPVDVEPPPEAVVDVDRSEYKAA